MDRERQREELVAEERKGCVSEQDSFLTLDSFRKQRRQHGDTEQMRMRWR